MVNLLGRFLFNNFFNKKLIFFGYFVKNCHRPSTPVAYLMTDRFQKEWLQQHEKRELELLAAEKVI
jgi:hypothetical protein